MSELLRMWRVRLKKISLREKWELSKLSVCVLSSEYLSNVKVMHVFKCYLFKVLINIIIIIIIIIFISLALYCLLYCSVCVVQGIIIQKKKRETRAATGNTCSASCCTATEQQAHWRLNSPSELCFDGFHLVWLQIVALMSVYVTRCVWETW